ncbi:MAG TPA: radical SAM protein [Candidatus Omnitrophota bacterium]|nr:radical SAM protein [Candidatus Omnitrophota bacterium]
MRDLPRLLLAGSIDLTYRCNNNCRHCWLWRAPDAKEKKEELSFARIQRVVDEARALGCRHWSVSGGEPMLRPDFMDILSYIIRNSSGYSLNTNGTLITPKIARLLKAKGDKKVAIYGATAKVHDHITRNAGSFEQTMRGFRYLKEAGAGFTVQIIPMKDNYRQFKNMVKLAESLSPHWRIGAPWLFLSACNDARKNEEIRAQRLLPKDVIALDQPDISFEAWAKEQEPPALCQQRDTGYLFSACIPSRREIHIDPYGRASFCSFIKDPGLRYDLKKGSVRECWDTFIPSLVKKVKVTEEYRQNCGSCDMKSDCRWCPVYSFFEYRRYTAKIPYLCAVARENRRFKQEWLRKHRRFYRIADVTLQIDSDLPITDKMFDKKFKQFEVNGPGDDTISIRHHFELLDISGRDLGTEVYRKPPWAVYRNNGSWVYLGILLGKNNRALHKVAVFNEGHTRARIYNDGEKHFLKNPAQSLTMFPTDQILLARILADRQGCYLHSCGVAMKGRGFMFCGHSSAGKSTMARMLKKKAEILCDDRNIVRRRPEGFRLYGTWSHGDVPDISASSAPLAAIFFLHKSGKNEIERISDPRIIARHLLAVVIKPFVTADWWDKTLGLIDMIARDVPCYDLRFDKSGRIAKILDDFCADENTTVR